MLRLLFISIWRALMPIFHCTPKATDLILNLNAYPSHKRGNKVKKSIYPKPVAIRPMRWHTAMTGV